MNMKGKQKLNQQPLNSPMLSLGTHTFFYPMLSKESRFPVKSQQDRMQPQRKQNEVMYGCFCLPQSLLLRVFPEEQAVSTSESLKGHNYSYYVHGVFSLSAYCVPPGIPFKVSLSAITLPVLQIRKQVLEGEAATQLRAKNQEHFMFSPVSILKQ